jgi:hypothetical protein
LTWGGQTYETSDGRVNGNLQISTVNVEDGVDIQATEVVMLTFFDLNSRREASAVQSFSRAREMFIIILFIITLLIQT